MAHRFKTEKDKFIGLASMDTFPTESVHAVGVDIGVDGLHVCVPDQLNRAANWRVWFLQYEEHPDWHKFITRLCRAGTIITGEPTGWHYLSPLASIIDQLTPARLYLVDHATTGKVRSLQVAAQKTDSTDARALAYIADQIYNRKSPRGVWHHDT
jgi:hypothetical protein